MPVILGLIVLAQFIWLLWLQDSLGGLRFKIRRLEQQLSQNPSGAPQSAPAQPWQASVSPALQTPPAPRWCSLNT